MDKSFISKKRFFDNKNYPRGFSRQGDFTIKEAQLLEAHGEAFRELIDGSRKANTKVEKHFIEVINGKHEPENEYEKVWLKYLKLVNRVKKFHTLSGGKPQIEGTEDYSDPEG